MTETPIASNISSEVAKLRLIRGTNPPPTERCFDDPYVVKDAMFFNMDISRSREPVPEIGKRGVGYAFGPTHVYGWFECFFHYEDVSPINRDLLSLRSDGANEHFYADVHYEDGRYLTVPIRITERFPLNENEGVRFYFVCTALPKYIKYS